MFNNTKEEIEAIYLPLAENTTLNWSPLAPKEGLIVNTIIPVDPSVDKRISTSPIIMSIRRKKSATPGVYNSADFK